MGNRSNYYHRRQPEQINIGPISPARLSFPGPFGPTSSNHDHENELIDDEYLYHQQFSENTTVPTLEPKPQAHRRSLSLDDGFCARTERQTDTQPKAKINAAQRGVLLGLSDTTTMPRPYSSRGAAAGAASVATPIATSTATITTSTRPQKPLLARKAKAPLTLPLEPSSSTKTTPSSGLQLDWDLTLSPLSASFARGSASALRSAGLATPQKSTFGFDLDFGSTATSAGRGSISTRSVSTSASFNDMASSKRISSIGSFYYEASETFDNQPDFHSADEALAAGAPTSPLRATVGLSTLATGEESASETTAGEKLSLNNKPGPVVPPGLGPSSVSPGGAAGNSAAATNSIVTLTGSPGSGTSQLGHPLAISSGAQISPVLNHRLQSPEANPSQSNATGSGGISRAASTSKGAVNNSVNSASSLFSTAPVSSNTATIANQRQSSPTNIPISSTSTSTSTGSTTATIASTSTTTTTALSAICSPSPPSSSSPPSPPLSFSPSPSPASASASAVFSTSSLAALPQQPQAKKALRKKTREQPAVPQIEPPSSQTLVNTAVTSVSSPSAVAAASGPPESESCLLDSATITPVSFPPDDSASLPSTSSTGMSTSSHEHDYRDYSRQCDRDRDSHDLSLPARNVTRDSLMTNMLLSLDQFSSISSSSPAAAITGSADILPGSATATHSTVQPIPISLASHARQQPASHLLDYSSSAPFADRTWSCSTSNSPHSAAAATVLAHARTRTRTRANTHGGNSYSSDFDIPDDASSRISSRAGRRSNSSSNFYYPPPSGLGRMSSLRSQHTPPRYQIHSRSGRGSKSSSTNSFDGVYIQAVNNQRWIQNQPAFSTPVSTTSVDYNLSSSPPQISSTTTAAQFLQQQNQRDHIFLRQAQSTHSFGLSNKVVQRKPSWQVDHDSSFAGEDYDAAPPPAVPGGPRRIARSASSTVPSSSHGGSPHIDTPVTPRTARPPLPPPPPVESPQPSTLERKRSIRSIKSTATNTTRRLDSIKSHQQPHKFETTPPLPAMDGESAPSPNVGYEKTKENASTATPQVQTTQNSGQNPKEKQGFFRRVFGSRAATSSTATATAPSAPQSIESSPVDLPDRTKSQSTPPSRETPPLPHHILQKKTSAFFRRRKKSINDHDAPPPLPMPPPLPTTAMSSSSPPTTTEIPPSVLPANGSGTGTAAAAAGPATAAATATSAKTKTTATPTDSHKTVPSTTATSGPDSVLASGIPLPSSVLTVLPSKFADHPPEPSPVSSLRKVMNPYLKGSPITGVPSSLGLEEYILPSTPERPANRRHSTTPNDHGYKRSFSPEYDPSPTAVIRKVDRDADSVHSTASENANGSHTPRNTKNAHQMVNQNRQRPSARDTSSNKPSFNASGRANSFLNLDQASDGEGEGDASVVAGYASSKNTRRGIGASEIRRRDRSRDAGLDDDRRSSVLLPIEGVRQDSSDMNGLVSLASNTANTASAMNIPTIIGGDEKDGALMKPENIDEPDLFVIGDPSDDDRSKAQKIFDGDESFIQREKAAAWMGEEGPVRQRVLRAYIELYDFSNTSIVESLRSVCNRLIFRAETQQVDRILVCFSNRWAACNPNHGFKTIDVIHTICYSIFLLNTDLHMADIEQKMTRSQFVYNTMETIRQALEDSDPDYCDQADNLTVKQQEAGFRSSHQAPSKRSSFLPLRPNDNSGFATSLADLDECGVLVKAPFEGSFKAWQSVVEIVLKDIYASIRDARLPLMGAEAGRYLASGNAHQAGGLSVRGMLKRSPSVLSKTPSESQTSIRGRIPDSSSRNSSSRWPSKSRSRPRFGAPGFSSSRTSFDDQNSVWSPSPSSATWSKQSLGRTQTSMSMDSFGSGFARSDFQQSIGFANALSQSIIRDELPGTASIVDDDMKTSMPLLDDESLELAGPPWIKEGLVSHKHHLDGVDKKAKDRNWSETFAVIQKGKLSIFSFQPNKSMRQRRNARNTRNKGPITVGGGNWQDNATNLGTFDLRQTLASALPPPGYSRTRPHVWALSLPTGAVHLFQAGTEELVKEFVTTVNYWSARLSTHPLVGGISNIEYGWSSNIVNNSLVTAITESTAGVPSASNTTITDTASTKDGVPSISSRPGSSAAVHGRHASMTNSVRSARSASFDQGFGSTMTSAALGRGKLPGDRVHITDWSPPTQSMRPSKLGEAEQLASLQTYVRGIEADLQVHNQLRSPMLLAFTPRGANAARAMANWERKSAYLLREIVKFRTYVDCLQQAETRRAEIYAEREHARRAARGELDLSGDDQSDVMP